MTKKHTLALLPDEVILNKIFVIRGQKVMLDSDLSELYQVETKRLKEQVRRNMARFPAQYMFELSENEFELLKSQIPISQTGRGGARYLPMVFTEHGILQLSNVLKSKRAIEVSFKIIDVFVKLRQVLADTTHIKLLIEELRKKTDNNTKNIELVFQYLDELMAKNTKDKDRKPIGFKLPNRKK